MPLESWIKLYRAIIDKPIWKQSTPEQKTILITLLCMVNHKSEEWEWQGKKFICKPGQKITSLEKIRKACGKGVSIQNIRTAFVRFEKLEFLTYESTKESRLVTVLNWELYQSEEKNQQSNQQTGNKDLTTNKNKDIYITVQHLSMTKKEYDKLIVLYGQITVNEKVEYARNYAKLKNYVSLYRTLYNWLKSDKSNPPNKPQSSNPFLDKLKEMQNEQN